MRGGEEEKRNKKKYMNVRMNERYDRKGAFV
jgi:hypothetical protein